MTALVLIGRSSSHFTRIVRIYAQELGADLQLEPVFELMSKQSATFGDNPLLTVPSLRSPTGTWFGSLNCCRELARQTASPLRLCWPEHSATPSAANAQEVVTSAMNAGVGIILTRSAGLEDDHPALEKPLARLRGALGWLDIHLEAALATQAAYDLGFLEVSAYCLLTHLDFRGLGRVKEYPRLAAFCESFSARPSARATPYAFDQPLA